jgi:hypothetical protein
MSLKVLWDVVRAAATRAGIDKLARTTCGVRVPVSATSRAADWIRSSSCSATSRSRRRSATSDASRGSGLPRARRRLTRTAARAGASIRLGDYSGPRDLLDVLCLGKAAIVNDVVAYSDQFGDPPRVSGNVRRCERAT